MISIKLLTCAVTVVLSAASGYAEENYKGIEVDETAGLERKLWPIQVGVPVPKDASAESLFLVRVDTNGHLQKVDFQLVEEIATVGHDSRWGHLQGMKMFEVAFLTRLPARASLDFRLYYNAPETNAAPPATTPSLNIEQGDGLGRIIDTGPARFEFHPDSGQMIKYNVAGTDYFPELLRARNNPVHGGADLRTSRNNIRFWDLKDKDHDLKYKESSGPVTWQTVREGYLPFSGRQIEVSISYTAFAGMPFIITSSYIHFLSDRAVAGVRNNQLVFDRGFHTHGAYIGHDGEFVALQAFNKEDPAEHFGNLGIEPLPPDIPFIGMFHRDRGYGIGLVTLGRANLREERLASPQDSGAHYYFLDSDLFGKGNPKNFFYLIRVESYHNQHKLVIPAGTVFSSRTAILTYPVRADGNELEYIEAVKRWTKLLRNPPRVFVK